MAATPAIRAHLTDLFPDTMDAYKVVQNGYGTKSLVGSGDVLNIPCRVSMLPDAKKRTFKIAGGKELVSTIKVTCNAVNNLTVKDFVFDLSSLSSNYLPSTSEAGGVEAIAITTPTDENGPHHEVVWFL